MRKAREVPLGLLQEMVHKYVTKFGDNIFHADIFKLRTVVRLTVIYFTFCCLSDYRQLQARHFEKVGRDILVTFPSSKNDQFHHGSSTLLKENDSGFCPVKILRLYFKRLGFNFGKEAADKSYLHCRVRKEGGWRRGDGRVAASESKAREELKALLKDIGVEAEGITDKSFKMLEE